LKILRFLSMLLRVGLFVLLLLLVGKNGDPVTLYFFPGNSLQAPLSVLLFGFLAFGAILGILACLGSLFRRSRRIRELQRELDAARAGAGSAAVPQPPSADAAG
jgi:uncharacterized integral membrane protein